MCIFTGSPGNSPLDHVGDTKIFARGVGPWQMLAYQMHYEAHDDLAMILPIPIKLHQPESAVHFIDLQHYPEFFDDMLNGFQTALKPRGRDLSLGSAKSTLKVHGVGSFQASYVPAIDDFERLDGRFRLPTSVISQLTARYVGYGFAVAKLKPGAVTIHPFAFQFLRRDDVLFFPTVHVHDGTVPVRATFDHELFCQGDAAALLSWQLSSTVNFSDHGVAFAKDFMDVKRAEGLIDPNLACRRLTLHGLLLNQDCIFASN